MVRQESTGTYGDGSCQTPNGCAGSLLMGQAAAGSFSAAMRCIYRGAQGPTPSAREVRNAEAVHSIASAIRIMPLPESTAFPWPRTGPVGPIMAGINTSTSRGQSDQRLEWGGRSSASSPVPTFVTGLPLVLVPLLRPFAVGVLVVLVPGLGTLMSGLGVAVSRFSAVPVRLGATPVRRCLLRGPDLRPRPGHPGVAHRSDW